MDRPHGAPEPLFPSTTQSTRPRHLHPRGCAWWGPSLPTHTPHLPRRARHGDPRCGDGVEGLSSDTSHEHRRLINSTHSRGLGGGGGVSSAAPGLEPGPLVMNPENPGDCDPVDTAANAAAGWPVCGPSTGALGKRRLPLWTAGGGSGPGSGLSSASTWSGSLRGLPSRALVSSPSHWAGLNRRPSCCRPEPPAQAGAYRQP